MIKICIRCKIEKELLEFSKDKRFKDELNCYCKECQSEISKKNYNPITKKQYHQRTKLIHNRGRILKLYGITLEWYEQKLKEQNGVCAVCGKEETALYKLNVRQLSVDHNHKTGKPRELLCANCNHVLGFSNENIEILQKAINYLKKHGATNGSL
jgi:hypothetical protein